MKDREIILNDLIDQIAENTEQNLKIKNSISIYRESIKALENFDPSLVRKELWPKKILPMNVFNNANTKII